MKRNIYLFICIVLLSIPQKLYSSSFVVYSPNDTGVGTLRQAITDANALFGHDTIEFNLSGLGNWNIILSNSLPNVLDTLTINGLSQPGSTFPNNLIKINRSLLYTTLLRIQYSGTLIYGLHFDDTYSGGTAIEYSTNSIFYTLSDSKISSCKFTNWNMGVELDRDRYNNFIFSNNVLVNVRYGIDISTISISNNFIITDNSFSGISSTGTGIDYNGIHNDTLPWHGFFVSGNTFSNYVKGVKLNIGGYASQIEIDSNFFEYIGENSIEFGCTGPYHVKLDSVKIRDNDFDSTTVGRAVHINMIATGGLQVEFRNIEISGNQIQSSIYDGIFINMGGTGGVDFLLSNVLIENNFISSLVNGIRFNLSGTGGAFFEMNSTTVRSNTLSNCKVGIKLYSGGTGLSRSSISNFNIENNIIENNFEEGIYLYHHATGSLPVNIDSIKIKSNDVHNNLFDGIKIDCGSSPNIGHTMKNISILDNIIYGNLRNGINVSNWSSIMHGVNFRTNSIFSNGLKGIVTFDSDTGYANPVIPVAVLDSVVYGSINGNLYGHLSSQPLTKYIAEIFTNSIPDSSGFGEGKTFLDTVDFVTDATGYAQFQISVPLSTSSLYFSATVTDSVENCTSPFSNTISSLTTSMNEVSKQELLIYPNPTSNLVFVSIPPSSKIHQIELMNLTGQVISRFDVKEGESVVSFSTLDYPSGCYLFKASGESLLLSKLIIQHD